MILFFIVPSSTLEAERMKKETKSFPGPLWKPGKRCGYSYFVLVQGRREGVLPDLYAVHLDSE